jgi:hypothetical protein
VGTTRKPIKHAFREWVERARPTLVTEAQWLALRTELAPVSEAYLRELLQNAEIPVEQPYAGVRQHTLDDLETSLGELLQVYRAAETAGDRKRARYCRKQVIAAKDRAKFAARNAKLTEEKRSLKREMVEWMLVWLGDPEVFPPWVEARKRACGPITTFVESSLPATESPTS